MYTKPQKRFEGKCYKRDKKGHKSSDCWLKIEKWCSTCKSKIHNTKDCRSKKDGKDAAKIANEPKNEDNDEHSFAFTLKGSDDSDDSDDQRRRNVQNENLLVETGATSHIINDSSKFINFDNNFDPSTHFMELADGNKSNVVLGKGNAKLYDVRGNLHDVMFYNVLYIPSYNQNIFSVSAEVGRGGSVNLSKQVSKCTTEEGNVFKIR